MALATPTFAIAAALAVTPNLESAPYVGDPPIYLCEASIDGKWQPKTNPEQTDAGQVCKIGIPSTISEGQHNVKGRYWFRINGVNKAGPLSNTFWFRTYKADGGASFWSWEGAIVCENDCVEK